MEIRTPLSGFRAAEQSMAKRADRIARATLEGASGSDGSTAPTRTSSPEGSGEKASLEPDFVTDVVGMTTDRIAGTYDLKAMKVKDRMMGELLDILR